MNCPICYDEINSQTGNVTTSCGHSYHFSCISSWYSKGESASCPCCRKEMAGRELPQISKEEEEEEVMLTRQQLNAFLLSSGGRGLTDEMARSICDVWGVFMLSELNALCVGNGGRPLTEQLWNYLINLQEISYDEIHTFIGIPNTDELIRSSIENPVSGVLNANAEDFLPLSHVMAATKFQAIWRGFKARNTAAAQLLMNFSNS